MKDFNILTAPLDGFNLIEASAGTGKTYAIEGIFSRLIAEKDYSVDEILVVTFTVAATEELRMRIRKRLRLLLDALSGNISGESNDELALKYYSERNGSSGNRRIARIKRALIDFDRCSILTIHGFCRKVLADNAVESGSLFDTDLATDEMKIISSVSDDFWRREIALLPPEIISVIVPGKISRNDFVHLAAAKTVDPDIVLLPEHIPHNPESVSLLVAPLKAKFGLLKEIWTNQSSEIKKIIGDAVVSKVLKNNIYRPASLGSFFSDADFIFRAENPVMSGLAAARETVVYFSGSRLESAVSKGNDAPAHNFFSMCDDLVASIDLFIEAADMLVVYYRKRFLDGLEYEIEKKKNELNVRTFGELLRDTYRAVVSANGEKFTASVFSSYKAALIDEFQDTDPVQYRIFSSIFMRPGALLYLIGDPKQAIYRFRGADLFAYIEAASTAERKFTLRKNYRSTGGLVDSVNSIFERHQAPFVHKEINFPVTLSDRGMKNDNSPSFFIRMIDGGKSGNDDVSVSKSEAEELAARSCASEIADILEGRGARRFAEEDIAVLVRRRTQGEKIRSYLSQLGVSSVLYGSESVFASVEASELLIIMQAVADPGDESAVRLLNLLPEFGITADALYEKINNPGVWDSMISEFYEYRSLWVSSGFMVMFMRLIENRNVKQRLLLLPDGERKITNIMHCAELVHTQEHESGRGIDYLINWFSDRISSHSRDEEELRLETDSRAVRILTVHRSKGLEFPLVFAPFLWDEMIETDFVKYHMEKNGKYASVLDLSFTEQSKIYSDNELLAESVRLFYVAATRAREMTVITWGKITHGSAKNYLPSAPAYLFHNFAGHGKSGAVSTAERMSMVSYEDMKKEIEELELLSNGSVVVTPLYEFRSSPVQLSPVSETIGESKKFSADIDATWRVSSYSSIAAGHYDQAKTSDEDDAPGYGIDSPEDEIFSFPCGGVPGSGIHEIMEKIDFLMPDEKILDMTIQTTLSKFGIDLKWNNAAKMMIKNSLAAEISASEETIVLGNIDNKDMLREMEFFYPFEDTSSKKIYSIIGRDDVHDEKRIRGMMKGFIDLIFRSSSKYYIADWKTNHLGRRIEDYSPEKIESVMRDNSYDLQYSIYSVALHNYLSARLESYSYEKNFGGVIYIFMRGVRKEFPGSGIYFIRPDEKIITELGSHFRGKK